jgi:fatty acid desaturase
MDALLRVLVIALLIGFGIYRIIRYVNLGVTRSRTPAVFSTTGAVGLRPASEPTSLAPGAEPDRSHADSAAAFGGASVAILFWLLANGILWTALFVPPGIDGIPVIWRLFVGVFANLYLIRLAGRVGDQVTDRMQKRRAQRLNNTPF